MYEIQRKESARAVAPVPEKRSSAVDSARRAGVMSLASDEHPVRLTLEVAPGGDAVRVELVSKRFERLQAARARAMERASRPPREAAAPMSVSCRAASIASRATTPGSSRRADRRDASARWWEAVDESEPDRGGDEFPAAAATEGLITVADGQRSEAKGKPSFDPVSPSTRRRQNEKAGSRTERVSNAHTRSRPAAVVAAAVAAAPPRARLFARSAAAASEAHSRTRANQPPELGETKTKTKKKIEGGSNRVGGVPSSLALARCAACGSKTCGVTVSSDENLTRYRCRRDGLWRSRDARATIGVLAKGARRANVTKVVDEETYFLATPKNGSSPSFVPCARCGDAWYCDARCLAADWPRHRKDCAGVRRSFAPRDASGVILS